MLALLIARLAGQGWGDIFNLGGGKFDLAPLAVAAILFGATFGRNGLRLAIQGVLIGVVFLFLGRSIYGDWDQIAGTPWSFSIPWVLASLVLMGALYVCHASGWLLILRRFGHPVPYLPGMLVWSKSLLARYVPGNVLMVVGRVMMIEPYGVPKRISLTSVAYEQALLAAASATVVSIALPMWPDARTLSSFIWLILVIPPLAIVCLHPAVVGRVGNFALMKAGREPIAEFLPFRAVVTFIGYYCGTWVVAGLGLFCLVHAVGDIAFVDLPIVIASVPLAWLFALIVFIMPSGLGVRELIYTTTLAFAFSGDTGIASAFAVLARFWQTVIEIMFVLIVMGLVKRFHAGERVARRAPGTPAAKPQAANSPAAKPLLEKESERVLEVETTPPAS